MAYRQSDEDRNNFAWIKKDTSCATLLGIKLVSGSFRGLHPFELNLQYPITAIAGENGCGKSTLLAIAACAYHNSQDGYKPKDRVNSYYTFRYFFVQTASETPPEGIVIRYKFLRSRSTGKVSFLYQIRRKPVGGKWNKYDKRIERNVIYFGVQRVVPHFERRTHTFHRRRFTIDSLKETYRQQICTIAGRIIGKTYDTFEKHTHSKYTLPIATSRGVKYSGFNMGAGENAVFEILSTLFEAGRGSLLVIDELELGLHEQAQIRFVEELKKLCNKLHCQIICSTHSHVVLATLPPEGRIFLDTQGSHTTVTPGISPDFACGKLRGRNSGELDIFVEDAVASRILQLTLPLRIRRRINITPIGSSDALLHLLASRYLEKKDTCLCVLDGDKRNEHSAAKSHFRRYAETHFRESEEEMESWADKRLTYLPSNESPEKWLLRWCHRSTEKGILAEMWGVDDARVVEKALEEAQRAPAHKEFFTLGDAMQLPEDRVREDVIQLLRQSETNMVQEVVESIERLLDELN